HVQNDVEPLYDRQGAVCGCVSVCVDMTERTQVEGVLREADRRKDEFLATLSHELLNVSRITRNRIELRRERLDLCNAIRSAIETIEPLSEAAGHVVTVDLPD